MAFVPNRPILNPHFEGYKLSFSPSPYLANVPLEHKATQSRVGTHPLGFQAVSSRVRHNHLAVGEPSDSAVYIADDGGVVLVRVDDPNEANGSEIQSGVTMDVIFRLPAHQTLPRGQAEYPAAAHVTSDVWLVSDGHGYAYLLRLDSKSAGGAIAQLLATWQLRVDEVSTPFQLHTAVLVSQGSAIAVLSSSAPTASPSPTATTHREFDIWAVRVPIHDPSTEASDLQNQMPVSFDISWRRRGTDIPLFVKYHIANNSFLLLGGSSYGDAAPSTQNSYEPTPGELAPIPRLDETLETSAPPPYSWTQTDDTVTVAFALPGTTPKSNIAAIFKSTTLSLHVGNPPLPQPNYNAVPLWSAIHPSSSLWTWERGELNKAGLLTIHLDKAHVGTRWSHVFTQDIEPEVPETLDPSELAGIRESLDKYTSTLQDDASGLGHGIPSLATGERDNEVDSNVGRPVVLTWVGIDGSTPTSADGSPAVLLSLPLPGTPDPLTLVMKHDIDGPLYTLHDARAWSHTATFPALAFVLASKRDTRFTFHISSALALAFESGAREGGGGNVYLYHGSTPGDKWAKQSVFQMRAGVGALLGVGIVTSRAGRSSLLCLSERELTVCRGLT